MSSFLASLAYARCIVIRRSDRPVKRAYFVCSVISDMKFCKTQKKTLMGLFSEFIGLFSELSLNSIDLFSELSCDKNFFFGSCFYIIWNLIRQVSLQCSSTLTRSIKSGYSYALQFTDGNTNLQNQLPKRERDRGTQYCSTENLIKMYKLTYEDRELFNEDNLKWVYRYSPNKKQTIDAQNKRILRHHLKKKQLSNCATAENQINVP